MRSQSSPVQLFCEFGQVVHQRLTTSDHDDFTWVFSDLNNKVFYFSKRMFSCVPAVLHIAPYTTNIASAQANKIGGFSLVESFTLEGVKMFHHRKRGCF